MNIKDKVRKLKALADDPAAAPGEAANAREAADRLMAQHNLKDADIKEEPEGQWHGVWGQANAGNFWRVRDYHVGWDYVKVYPESPEQKKAREAQYKRWREAEKKRAEEERQWEERVWDAPVSDLKTREELEPAIEALSSDIYDEDWDQKTARRMVELLNEWLKRNPE